MLQKTPTPISSATEADIVAAAGHKNRGNHRVNRAHRIMLISMCLSAAPVVGPSAIVPKTASAMSVIAYTQQDSASQDKMLKDTYFATWARIVTMLRSDADTKGNPKTEERLRHDRERADRIDKVAVNVDSDKLANMIETAKDKQPTVELENVIMAYFLSEEREDEQKEHTESKQAAPHK